jgi:hypothetical protein
MAANDNQVILVPALDKAVAGQALTIAQAHRKFGQSYAEFVGHAGNGKHILVRKLISSMWKSRWSNPIKVERSLVIAVHDRMARAA